MHLQTLSEQLSLNTGLQLEGENTTCFGLKARIPFSLHAIRLGGSYEKWPTLWCYFPPLLHAECSGKTTTWRNNYFLRAGLVLCQISWLA